MNCPAQVESLPVGVLHLGPKAGALERAGLRKMSDLHELDEEQLIRIPGVGRSTAETILRNRKALYDASIGRADISWDVFCEQARLTLLPERSRPRSGSEFLDCLEDFLTKLAKSLDCETTASILSERICQRPADQKTLDELGAAVTPRITRERIRQKERDLLADLTGGLLNDSYGRTKLHFRPEFSCWWRLAADRLSHHEEIEFGEFVAALSEVWNVPAAAVFAHLPFILAIVTGDPQMKGSFRAACNANPKFYGPLSDELLLLPVNRLRVGKYAERLTEVGLETVGQIIARVKDGNLSMISGNTASVAAEQANLLAGCLDPEGKPVWKAYRQATKMPCLPDAAISCPADFVAGLRRTVIDILLNSHVTKRSVEIYQLRTSQPVATQQTLQAVADQLQTHLPSIKREATTLLTFLNDVLISHNFSSLSVWLDEKWLNYWKDAHASYVTSENEYSNFSQHLAWKWRLTERELSAAAPTLWAVLTGYPRDRRSAESVRLSKPVSERPAEVTRLPADRIRLRGFRRIH